MLQVLQVRGLGTEGLVVDFGVLLNFLVPGALISTLLFGGFFEAQVEVVGLGGPNSCP